MSVCLTENNFINNLKDTSSSLVNANQSSNSTSVSSDLSKLNENNAQFCSSSSSSSTSASNSNLPDSSSQACLADSANSNNKNDLEEFIKQQLIENSKDRVFMLQTEKSLVDFIKDEKSDNFKFQPMNPYYRMLVHRISAYFGLDHNVDQAKQCVIVKKIDKTKMPSQSFSAIIKAASETVTSDQSTLASPNSPSSPALASNNDSNQEESSNQIKTKQILKREINNNTSNQEFQNKKTVEPIKMKTYEEKSADYIRIKNRIFNGENNNNNSATNTNNQQFKILSNQTQQNEQLKQANNKQFKSIKNKNKNKQNINSSTMNGTHNNNTENFKANYSNIPAQAYQMQQQADNYNNHHQSFKMNNQIPIINEPYSFMYSNQHSQQHQQQQQHIKYNQASSQNAKSPKQQQIFSLPQYNQNTMHSMPHPQMISNNSSYYSQMPLHPPPPLQPPPPASQGQAVSQQMPHMHQLLPHPAQYYAPNSNNPTSFNSQQQNIAFYQPSYSREHLPLVDPNNSQFYHKQHQQYSAPQPQMFLNYHQMPNMNPYHGAIAQSSEYSQTNMSIPQASVLMPSNMSQQQNSTLSCSSSSSMKQPKYIYSSHLDDKQMNNNNTNMQYFKPSTESNIKQSTSFSSIPMNNYQNQYINNNMAYSNSKPNLNFNDNKLNNRKNKINNKQYNNNNNNNRGYNHSNSSLNLNNKYQFNKQPKQNYANKFAVQETASSPSSENEKLQVDSLTANNTITTTTDKSISFQVYNLKQNLTKQMLHDLLMPYVVSIDFKPTSNASTTSNASNEASDHHSVINEENENVFIKFENIDKLHEAFKSFNLNENELMNESNLANTSNPHTTTGENDNNNNTAAQLINEKNDTPFLLKPIIIC